MTLRRLREPPGSRCFVCAPGNPAGLAVRFHYDDTDRSVQAEVCFDERHCGAPGYVHAGLTGAVLAEAMAWAVVAGTGQFGVTLSCHTEYRRPLRVGTGYLVRARVADVAGPVVRTTVECLAGQRRYATGSARFQALSAAVAARLRARVSQPAGGSRP
jgi:acyl-coenzyme A thioesterase PaaI-like protein